MNETNLFSLEDLEPVVIGAVAVAAPKDDVDALTCGNFDGDVPDGVGGMKDDSF